jgi:hypothetical protein
MRNREIKFLVLNGVRNAKRCHKNVKTPQTNYLPEASDLK